MDLPHLRRRCPGDVPYLIRYETYAGHMRDIYGTSPYLPWLIYEADISVHLFKGNISSNDLLLLLDKL